MSSSKKAQKPVLGSVSVFAIYNKITPAEVQHDLDCAYLVSFYEDNMLPFPLTSINSLNLEKLSKNLQPAEKHIMKTIPHLLGEFYYSLSSRFSFQQPYILSVLSLQPPSQRIFWALGKNQHVVFTESPNGCDNNSYCTAEATFFLCQWSISP